MSEVGERKNRTATPVWIVVAFLSAVGVSWDVLGRPGLPEKYFFDSNKISAIVLGNLYVPEDKSFQAVGDVYRMIGLSDPAGLSRFIGMIAFSSVVAFAVRGSSIQSLTIPKLFSLLITMTAGATYLGGYSKEFLQLPFIALILLFLSHRAGLIFSSVVSVAYGLLFRQYWVLVSLVQLGFWLTYTRLDRKKIMSLLSVVAIVLVIFPQVANYFGLHLFDVRQNINDLREREAYSATAISYPFHGQGPVWDTLNFLIVFIWLSIPILGLGFLGPGYFLVGLAMTLMWVIFASAISVNSSKGNLSTNALAVCMSLLLVQTFFEPDFGSFLRHVTVILPIALAAIFRTSENADQSL